MSDEPKKETGPDELLVARFQIQSGSVANQSDISAELRGLKGVKSVTVARDLIEVVYDPLEAGEKHMEEIIRRGGDTLGRVETGWETPHPDLG